MYLWVKAFHIISVISWMAGLLYLPRLMVYHCDVEVGSELAATLKVMEQRLYRFIMGPAMIGSWMFGLWLVWIVSSHDGAGLWLYAKLLLVVGLTACHGFLGKQVRLFANDANERPAKFFRVVNEVPTVLMIVIVLLVVIKPFA